MEEELLEAANIKKALIKKSEQLERAQKIAHLGSWELDFLTNQLTWSDEAYRIFGLQPQKFKATYEAFLEAVHPDDRLLVDKAYSESLRKGRDSYEIEHRIINKTTGEVRVVHDKCEHFRDNSGKVIRSMGMVHDITDQKKAEELIISTKNEWEKTFDNMPDLVAVLDDKHRIVRINKTMTERLGISLNEIIGSNCFKCMHDANSPTVFCPHALTMQDGKEHTAEIYEEKLKGHFLITTTPLFNKDGKITGSIHVARDITLQKETEEKLRKYTHRLEIEKVKDEALLASIGHGVVAVNKNGKIIFANKIIYKFLNKNYSNLISKNLNDVLDIYNEKAYLSRPFNQPLAASLTGKAVISNNYFCFNKKGKKINLSIASTPIFLKDRVIGAVGIYEDITKQKDIEKSKIEFVSLASHQLRTPITEISLSAEMLSTGVAGKVTKKQKKYLKNIMFGVKEMTGLIETLLNISRIQMGTFIVNPKLMDLPVFVDKLVRNFSMQIRRRKLVLKRDYDKNLPKINLDPHIMNLVLENLFSNAIKYTKKGTVGISLKKNAKNVVIEIFDTGCGIPDKQKHLVFTRLFRADNLMKNKTAGHGLGLYIVKSMVKAAGGKIRFESEEGKGTTFFITLPLSGMKKKTQQSLI